MVDNTFSIDLSGSRYIDSAHMYYTGVMQYLTSLEEMICRDCDLAPDNTIIGGNMGATFIPAGIELMRMFYLPNLNKIDISNNNISVLPPTTSGTGWDGLTSIKINENIITDWGSIVSHTRNNLLVFEIANTGVNNTILSDIIIYNPNIKTLSVANNNLESISEDLFNLGSLKNLDISKNKIPYISDTLYQRLLSRSIVLKANEMITDDVVLSDGDVNKDYIISGYENIFNLVNQGNTFEYSIEDSQGTVLDTRNLNRANTNISIDSITKKLTIKENVFKKADTYTLSAKVSSGWFKDTVYKFTFTLNGNKIIKQDNSDDKTDNTTNKENNIVSDGKKDMPGTGSILLNNIMFMSMISIASIMLYKIRKIMHLS